MKLTVFAVLLACVWAATGCHSTRQITDYGPRYQPKNVVGVSNLPPSIRRVALLPVALHCDATTMTEGAENLAGVIETELRKAQVFELVRVTPQQLQQWTGHASWRADEALPKNLFQRIKIETGCEAVLFATLTAFRPYPPLAIGWDLRLVEAQSTHVLWAVDEVLDAGAAPVARSAKDYSEAELHAGHGADDSTVLNSPRRFAQFAAAMLTATIPAR